MQFAIKAVLGIVLFFILLFFPVLHIPWTPSAKPVYVHSIKTSETKKTGLDLKSSEFIFHTPLSGSYYSSFQYNIVKLDDKGNEALKFVAPASADVKKSRETAILDGKDGYLSYPPSGSFYLWYPKLGNYTFFYDQAGEFLWEHRSSHYMQAFPSGEYILAMTGDHSRAFFLLPNLSVIDSAEGTLLINYQFANKNDSISSYRVCLSFLDGDVVFFDPKQNKKVRVRTGNPTKSIACRFKTPSLAVHVEENGNDMIKIGAVENPENKPEIHWTGKIQLTGKYDFTLPMGISEKFILLILPSGENLTAFTYDLHGRLIGSTDLGKADTPIDDWRIIPENNMIIAWSSKKVLGFNPGRIFEKAVSVENVSLNGTQLFIQTPEEIISYSFQK